MADKNVYVLDPCCGPSAYVVEMLRKIEETLRAKGEDALIGQDVQEAARERIFGFEIMSAPFVIAHWQVGKLPDASREYVGMSLRDLAAECLTRSGESVRGMRTSPPH